MSTVRELMVGVPGRIAFNKYTYWPVLSAITKIPELPVESANGDAPNAATAPVVGSTVYMDSPSPQVPNKNRPRASTSLGKHGLSSVTLVFASTVKVPIASSRRSVTSPYWLFVTVPANTYGWGVCAVASETNVPAKMVASVNAQASEHARIHLPFAECCIEVLGLVGHFSRTREKPLGTVSGRCKLVN